MKPLFEHDPKKSDQNKTKHGLTLEQAESLWDGPHMIIPAKSIGDEMRAAILGCLKNRLYVAIFTERETVIRLISCHRADRRLNRLYEDHWHETKKSQNH